jgi:hypothetical protein
MNVPRSRRRTLSCNVGEPACVSVAVHLAGATKSDSDAKV